MEQPATDRTLSFRQWALKESVTFAELADIIKAQSRAYNTEREPPLDDWAKVRGLSLECLSEHSLSRDDDPIPVLASLINARAYCGEFDTSEISDDVYLEVRNTAASLLTHVHEWPEERRKDWMTLALEADIAVTDLRRMGRGFVDPNYEQLAKTLSAFLEKLWESENNLDGLNENYKTASEKYAPRVMGWMLEAILKTENRKELFIGILHRVDDTLKKAKNAEESNITNPCYSGVSNMAEALLDLAANEEDADLKSKILSLTDQALEFLTNSNQGIEKGSYWDKDIASMKEKRAILEIHFNS